MREPRTPEGIEAKRIFGSDVEWAAHPDPMTGEDWDEMANIIVEAAAPRGLDVERMRVAIRTVADDQRYDLQYSGEAHRLANDALNEYARLSNGPERTAYPTIDHARLQEIVREIRQAADEAYAQVSGPNEGDYYRGLGDAEEWVIGLLDPTDSSEPER